MKDLQSSTSFIRSLRATWTLLALALAFALGVFFTTLSLTKGAYAAEIAGLVVLGLAGGSLVRGFVRENLVAVLLIVLVVGECAVLSQFTEPWSRLWPLLIPANAVGVMVGNLVRAAVTESSRKAIRDVWVVNGVEEPHTPTATATSLAALSAWDSADSGRFFVQRNEGLFEAMGSPATGFIVHCASDFQDENEWRMLGSVGGNEETVVRIPSGPAYAPSGAVVDLDTATRALSGFFHHRGPDPELAWTSGAAVLDLKFGQP